MIRVGAHPDEILNSDKPVIEWLVEGDPDTYFKVAGELVRGPLQEHLDMTPALQRGLWVTLASVLMPFERHAFAKELVDRALAENCSRPDWLTPIQSGLEENVECDFSSSLTMDQVKDLLEASDVAICDGYKTEELMDGLARTGKNWPVNVDFITDLGDAYVVIEVIGREKPFASFQVTPSAVNKHQCYIQRTVGALTFVNALLRLFSGKNGTFTSRGKKDQGHPVNTSLVTGVKIVASRDGISISDDKGNKVRLSNERLAIECGAEVHQPEFLWAEWIMIIQGHK